MHHFGRFLGRARPFLEGSEDEAAAASPEMAQRFRFAGCSSSLSARLFAGYAVHFFFMGYLFAAALMLVGVLTIASGIILAATSWGMQVWNRVSVILLLGIFLPLFLHDVDLVGVKRRLDYLCWLSLYPLLGFFLFGEKAGFALTGIIFAIIGILFAIPRPGTVPRSTG